MVGRFGGVGCLGIKMKKGKAARELGALRTRGMGVEGGLAVRPEPIR